MHIGASHVGYKSRTPSGELNSVPIFHHARHLSMLPTRKVLGAIAASSLITLGHYTTSAMAATGMRTVKGLFSAPQLREGGGFLVRRSIGMDSL